MPSMKYDLKLLSTSNSIPTWQLPESSLVLWLLLKLGLDQNKAVLTDKDSVVI